jgi:hypothetical protein
MRLPREEFMSIEIVLDRFDGLLGKSPVGVFAPSTSPHSKGSNELLTGVINFPCVSFSHPSLWEREKGDESKELLTHVSNFVGRSASARRTAQLIGCHYRKVDKIRKIRRDGWTEIQDAVRNDECSINKAYDLIRDMELGEDDAKSGRKLSKAQVKVVKSVLSEQNFACLEAMGDDLGSLLNKAVEQFIQRV